jgi:chromosome segregation ATPase
MENIVPDSPLERGDGSPYDRGMEQRVTRLEDAMRDNTAAIARIDIAVTEIRVVLPSLTTKAELAQQIGQLATKAELAQQIAQLATKAEMSQQIALLATKAEVAEVRLDIAELGAKVDHLTQTMDRHLATKEDIAELRGYVKGLPTTWVMVTAIVAGQIGITGVIAGALLAAARMFMHT